MLMDLVSVNKLRGRFGGDKHLSCPICNKGMSSPHALKRHITCAHTDERPYVCCDCPKAFSRMDKFRNHLRRHYGFIYPCTVCGATFLRWFHWKKHTLTHTLLCDLCEFTCVSQAAMNRHITKHTGEKQFTCVYCSKQFWRNYHLQIHTRIHTGECLILHQICIIPICLLVRGVSLLILLPCSILGYILHTAKCLILV